MSFEAYSFWEEDYSQREKEFLDILGYIPLDTNHSNVWSLKLANQLLLIGSSIDSSFQSALPYCLNNYEQLDSSTKKELFDILEYGGTKVNGRKMRRINMGDYRKVFENFYKLSDETIYVLRNKDEIKPFEQWSTNKSPEWWKVYTNLKHNKFKNKKKATVKIVLEALAAFFLLNLWHVESRSYLVNYTEVFQSGLNLRDKNFLYPEMVIETLESIIAKTSLFGFIVKTTHNFRHKPWFILNPITGNNWLG